ncbi:MAG: serine/threonine protein kinase [Alphaproteobacteria bacterium]|nr:serine/threonine protein kinase [Alphaproteobacteria bacterium]
MVYRVRHNRLGTRHALKLLTIHGESIRRRLLQEGKAQATLGHLNIVAVTDIVDVGGNPGLLMEYIEGPSLEDALLEYRLTMSDAETLFIGVLAGVRAAHARGIIHRDLKPANVLLDPTPAGFVPKVADFGLAKAVRGEPLRQGSTRQGVAMGTPSYMAPEQIRDAGNVDERADLFSLGCILYEIITRRRAFPGEDTLEIYNNVAKGRYVPARRLVPDLPDRIDQAIRGCIQVDKNKRIPDCDTLAKVLKGELKWSLGVDPETLPDPPPIPSLASNIPPMTLAPRGEDGETPVPVSQRMLHNIPSFGADRETSETVEIDGTLMPYDVPPPPQRGGGLMAAALVLGSLVILALALLFAAIGFGVPLFLGLPETTVEVRTAPPPRAPVPVLPAEPAPLPDPVEPEPEPQPEPVAPEPRPTRVTPVPARPSVAEVKILSVPPSAAISVDGEASGRATPAKLELPVGRHRVQLESAGRVVDFSVSVDASGDSRWCYVFATGTAIAGNCPR